MPIEIWEASQIVRVCIKLEKQQRMIIIQNQQLTNEIEFQSKQITGLLEKNESLLQEIKQYKLDL